MARHSNGKNTFAMAGWVLALLAALILAIAVGLFFLLRGGDSPKATTAADSEVAETTAEASAAASTSKEAPSSTSTAADSSASSTSAAPDNEAGAALADNTLVLLDTSEGLAPYFNPVTQALAETATALGEKDGLVSLWNYSSPISRPPQWDTAKTLASARPAQWRLRFSSSVPVVFPKPVVQSLPR